eukprot:366245-Chlamydomonas_euryale.AAC.10
MKQLREGRAGVRPAGLMGCVARLAYGFGPGASPRPSNTHAQQPVPNVALEAAALQARQKSLPVPARLLRQTPRDAGVATSSRHRFAGACGCLLPRICLNARRRLQSKVRSNKAGTYQVGYNAAGVGA